MSSGTSPARRPTPKPLVAAGLLALLVCLSMDAMPQTSLLHGRLHETVLPALEVVGIDQGIWTLFAPQVDRVNRRLTARVHYRGGAQSVWRSPDWPALSRWQRTTGFRWLEYYETVQLQENKAAWPALARFIARTVSPPSADPAARPVRVMLRRRWGQVPTPRADQPLPAFAPASPRRQGAFFTWRAS